MKRFQDITIQNKLLVMALANCGLVLLVAITMLFSFQVWNFRSNFVRDTAVLASVIADNRTTALAFNDAKTAAEVVNSLQAQPNLMAACLILPDGSVMARYGKVADEPNVSRFLEAGKSVFSDGYLFHTQAVELDQKRVGTLCLQLDYGKAFHELLGFYGLAILLVVITALILSVLLTKRMGRGITDPILTLVSTTKKIGERQGHPFTPPASRCELKQLMQTFNEMGKHVKREDTTFRHNRDVEIDESREKLRSLIHSIDGIVWEATPRTGFAFTFVSSQIERILGYTPEMCLSHPGFWQEKLHVQDVARVIQTCEDMVAHHQSYNQEYRILAADGRWVWIRESVMVQVEKNEPTALRGIFQDVTEQNIAAEQLVALNRKLVETSRCAGMAEVATGVLHNVGNVLNSLSVSATLVSDRMRRSKAGNLRRAATMLRTQNGHLAEFLTVDPKGKMLPDYLCKVADELADDQDKAISEMTFVDRQIEHIKEIVARQQSYAKVSGAYEEVSASELVEEALRMNADSFERHFIRVEREMARDLPPICVDRHKVLQILINLLRNAKYALDNQSEENKRLIIQVRLSTPERVSIVICDNGIGIAPENLTKIFNHGFTTKKDGHGFGLHSGANAAKEMGGLLTARSQGLGQGAAFTLELPVAKGALKKPDATHQS